MKEDASSQQKKKKTKIKLNKDEGATYQKWFEQHMVKNEATGNKVSYPTFLNSQAARLALVSED